MSFDPWAIARQLDAELDRRAAANQDEVNARQLCGRLTRHGNATDLILFYEQHIEGASIGPRKTTTPPEEFARSSVRFVAYSTDWRDNLDNGRLLNGADEFVFEHGCTVTRSKGSGRNMTLTCRSDPWRILKLGWRHGHWAVVQKRGWGRNGSAPAIHAKSRPLRTA